MSRSQRPRTPEHFPRMKHRAKKREFLKQWAEQIEYLFPDDDPEGDWICEHTRPDLAHLFGDPRGRALVEGILERKRAADA